MGQSDTKTLVGARSIVVGEVTGRYKRYRHRYTVLMTGPRIQTFAVEVGKESEGGEGGEGWLPRVILRVSGCGNSRV